MLDDRFAVVGALTGAVMSMTTGWLITGYLCHSFQKATPSTWRPEGWTQHALAVLCAALGGSVLGALDGEALWGHASAKSALVFAVLIWGVIAAPMLTLATYVNLHRMVVAGLLCEWLLFAVGVSLACWRWT